MADSQSIEVLIDGYGNIHLTNDKEKYMGNLWPIALSADLTPLCQVIADILQSGHDC